MNKKSMTIKEFNESINKWVGNDIKVLKHEANDLDETIISLDKVTYKENLYRIDDYEPKYVLQLEGVGFVENESNSFQPLPDSVYEVALDDETEYRFDGSQFQLTTDRGTYSIQLISPTES